VPPAKVSWQSETKLRFAVGNAVPRDYVTRNTILADGQRQTVLSRGPTSRTASLRVEMKL
jgi:hypothetical protein